MLRKTVGKLAHDLMLKDQETRDPIEIQREIHKDYDKHIQECVDRTKKEHDGDFYIVVITKKERLMKNVLRSFFLGRKSCPTPEWDQTVYKYHRSDDRIEFLWVVPAKDVCEHFKDNMLVIDDKERELLKFVLDYQDGTLLALSKKLNNEVADSTLLQERN